MKRVILATTSLVMAGGMAAAEVTLSGSAEMGVTGSKGADAKLHRDMRVSFGLSGATDTGLSFGTSLNLKDAGKYQPGGASGNVHLMGAFGTLTLGDTNGAFDQALAEPWTGSAGSINDDHTGHSGNGAGGNNNGIDGLTGNGGSILRYDYTLGGITTSVSGEFGAEDSGDSVLGVGVAWSGDMGGIGVGIGLGYQTGSANVAAVEAAADGSTDAMPAHVDNSSVTGVSISVDMGNGLSTVINASSRDRNRDAAGTADDETDKITYTGMGVAYTVGDLTLGVNGGRETVKGTNAQTNSGAGFAAAYSLGTGVTFQVGANAGKEGSTSTSSWSAGLAFSF